MYEQYPKELSGLLTGYKPQNLIDGRLGESIQELHNDSGEVVFLKQAVINSDRQLYEEQLRLKWLQGKLPVPEVRYYHKNTEITYLLLSSIPGQPAYILPESMGVEKALTIVAEALKCIHALDIHDCPFTSALDIQLDEIQSLLNNNKIEIEKFENAVPGHTPQTLYEYLRDNRNKLSDTHFTHGDYCLPNVIINKMKFGGLLDWSNAGVGDPYIDFSAIEGSITRNFGADYIPFFYQQYGLVYAHIDRIKIEYYKFIDQFHYHTID